MIAVRDYVIVDNDHLIMIIINIRVEWQIIREIIRENKGIRDKVKYIY